MNSSLLTSRLNEVIFLSPAVEAFGWTLLHFVWQGTLVALAFGCFLAFSQGTSPRVRYLVGCAALSLMALAAVSTFLWQVGTRDVLTARQSVAPRIVMLTPGGRGNSLGARGPIGRVSSRPLFLGHDSVLESQPTRDSSTAIEPLVVPAGAQFVSLTTKLAESPDPVRPWLNWLVGLWIAGVVLLSVRLAAGWRVIGRLRAQGQSKKDSVWCTRFACLKERIGVSSSVQLLWSASASVPMVIGWARPVVLVPTALLTGLSASQLEAVLAHELAHIRRHDYLVNLLQNALETLLFYHPAVWWISEQVRNEREHCCDDLAAAACGGSLKYARALTALAELRHTSGSLGLAATGGSLVARVARLAGMRSPSPRVGWPLTALVLVGGAVAAFLAAHRSGFSDDAHVPAADRVRGMFSLSGRVLDPWGKPVAQANVWVAASNGKEHGFDGFPIVGSGPSSADGRFDLALNKSVLEQFTASDGARYEVWVRKPGLALACHVERDGFPHHPIEIQLRPQDPVSLRLRNPDGSPCAGANVFPTSALYGDERFVVIPEVIRNELKVQSAADGRATIVGMGAGQIEELCFATAHFGVQGCRFPSYEWPDSETADITLRKTGTLQGRLAPPAGLKPPFGRLKLHVNTSFSGPQDGSPQWSDVLTIQPDHEGKFTIPKIPEGTVRIFVDLPDDCDCRSDGFGLRGDRSHEKLLIVPGRTSVVEVPMWKGVRVKRLVRDSQTKKPLLGVSVTMQSEVSRVSGKTDKNGIFARWIHPDTAYHVDLDLPRGYVRTSAVSSNSVQVPFSPAERELEPVELIAGRRVEGMVVDASRQPFNGIRVHAECRFPDEEPAGGRKKGMKVEQWTTSDAQGRFHFDDLASGAQITLTPVRAQVVLADPLRIKPGNDKPVRLQTRPFEFASIAGCVVDRSGYPVAGVEVMVQLTRSNKTADALRMRTDALGRFKTPAYFPKQTEFRVAVTARKKEIASSAPRRVSDANEPVPDLVIDRADASEASKLDGTEVVADVNGEQILASEVFQRAWFTPLGPNQTSLMAAANEVKAGRLRKDEYRQLQELAIRKFLHELIRTRRLAQALLENLDEEETLRAEAAISKMFDEYVEKLKQDLHVSSRYQVDVKLQGQGQSLQYLRREMRFRVLADEYLRKQQQALSISRETLEAYYRNHQSEYRFPEKVRWQLLEIGFERHGGRQTARSVAEQAAAELKRGESFASVVRKYYDSPRAEEGVEVSRRTVAGPLPRPSADWWTKLDSPNDQDRADAIHQFAAGDVKAVFNRAEWGHVELAQQSDSPSLLASTTPVAEVSTGPLKTRSVQLQRAPSRFRRVRLHSRYARELNMVSRPVPNGMPREQVTIITGGANLLFEGLDQRVGGKRGGTIDLSADRMVIWSQGELDDAVNWQGGIVQSAEEPLEVYLEGNVVIFQKDPSNPQLMRRVHAEAATFDALERRSLLLDAKLEAYLSSKKGSVRFWAERMRQLGPSPFHIKGVSTNSSVSAKAGDGVPPADASTEVPARGAENLRQPEAADQAARKFFSADGGIQPWTNPVSVADPRLAAVLEQLSPGETSSVLESAESFRIVRVLEKRPAGCKPFDEVELSIRRKLEEQRQQEIFESLFRRTTIESPYLSESQTKSPVDATP